VPAWLEALLASAPALLHALFWAVLAVMHHRHLRLPARHASGPVTLVLPLTGAAPGLEALFAALAAQTLTPRRLLATVESEDDPAAARVRALAPRLPFPVAVVLAGRSDRRAQKNTNLLAALARIDAEDACVVLLDADIRPRPWWLSALATPVLLGEAALVTGYRWPLLDRAGPVPHLVAWFDRTIALMPKLKRLRAVWGGSLAIDPHALPALDLPRLLDRALSDDLAIGARGRGGAARADPPRAAASDADGGPGARRLGLHAAADAAHPPLPAGLVVGDGTGDARGAGLLDLAGGAGAADGVGGGAPRGDRGLRRGALAGDGAGRAAHRRAGPGGGPLGAIADRAAAAARAGVRLRAVLGQPRTRRIRWQHVEYEVAGPNAVRVARRFGHVA
jgi:hypothetical protein